MTAKPQQKPRFEIDASIVYELGEKLISDEVQALVELVKNSYDADASYASVTIETDEMAGDNSLRFPESGGYIIVEDDGFGMNRNEISQGWLTISSSPKREMKAQGKTTKKGRTPLGHKGLGRLGSQRLGRRIEIWTAKEETNPEYYVGIDWSDFQGEILSNVPIHLETKQKEKARKGTKVVLCDLRSPEKWKGRSLGELTRKLSQLLFPFEELRPFDVVLAVNGKRIDLDNISRRVFDVADAEFTFSFDGKSLSVKGQYRLQFLLTTTQGEYPKQRFQQLVGLDQGADYYAYLTAKKSKSKPNLVWEDASGWFVSFEETCALEDLGDVEVIDELPLGALSLDEELKGKPANPGPFHGVIYSFTRRGTDLSAISDIFTLEDEFSKYIERHAGIRVFRNGFGVRPFGLDGDDWLQLASGWTSAQSYYVLRPANVVGYVALTAKENSQLEEATDREGFVENAYFRNFHLLMREAVKTINSANTKLRRGYRDYGRLRAEQETDFRSQDVSEIFDQMRDIAEASKSMESRIAETHDDIESVREQVQVLAQEAKSTPLFRSEKEREFAPLLQEITDTLGEATSILKQLDAILPEAKHMGAIADLLEPDIQHLREELEMFSELAGLGITAEALSHEMSIIADGLAARTKALLSKLKRRKGPDPEVVTYTEHIHTAVGRMRKQLSHLDPSLRYVREQRNRISMLSFFESIRDFYSERFERNGLGIELDKHFEDFTILISKGKLTQVVDNLLLNSEYWLREDLRKERISEAVVFIRARAPMIDIYDTGRGVAPSVEHYLFQPFVTTKPKGRGLGLFIARQLLDSSGCLISLLPDKNQYGRRYVFRLDLAGASVDG